MSLSTSGLGVGRPPLDAGQKQERSSGGEAGTVLALRTWTGVGRPESKASRLGSGLPLGGQKEEGGLGQGRRPTLSGQYRSSSGTSPTGQASWE